jgi:hypothetical protein
LNWTGGDPNALDVVTYSIYWGLAADALQLEAADLTQNIYSKSNLNQGVTYYWQVVAKDDKGAETTGPVWHFTTDGDPPDLIISMVTTDPPGHLQSGQTVTLMATVNNSGIGPTVDTFTVNFMINGASIGTATVDPILLSGESMQVSQTWTYGGGDPSIEVIVDDQSQVNETDEQNNTFTAPLSQVADNTPPALINTLPADGMHIQQAQSIAATLADNQGTVNDAAVINSFSVVDGSSGAIAGTVSESNDTFAFVPAVLPLADSTYTVSLTASDTHGNTQLYSFVFTVDTQPPAKPVITGGMVDSGAIEARPEQNVSEQFKIQLTGTREPGTSVWINGVEKVGLGDTPWAVQFILQPGANALEVWLKDLAGNQGASEWVDIEIATGGSVNYEYDTSGRIKRIHSDQ